MLLYHAIIKTNNELKPHTEHFSANDYKDAVAIMRELSTGLNVNDCHLFNAAGVEIAWHDKINGKCKWCGNITTLIHYTSPYNELFTVCEDCVNAASDYYLEHGQNRFN